MIITASLLILAVMVLRKCAKDMPKSFRLVLWAVVGLRLILPFSFESRLGILPGTSTFASVYFLSYGMRNGPEQREDLFLNISIFFYDLNGDGQDELFFFRDGSIIRMYDLVDGKANLLYSHTGWSSDTYNTYIRSDGRFVKNVSGGARTGYWMFYEISEDGYKLIESEAWFFGYGFYFEDGLNRIFYNPNGIIDGDMEDPETELEEDEAIIGDLYAYPCYSGETTKLSDFYREMFPDKKN